MTLYVIKWTHHTRKVDVYEIIGHCFALYYRSVAYWLCYLVFLNQIKRHLPVLRPQKVFCAAQNHVKVRGI